MRSSVSKGSSGSSSKCGNSVPPLAPQPDSIIRLFEVAQLADTRPLHWVRDPDYDPNRDFDEAVYVMMHPEWVNQRLPKDMSTLPWRSTRGIFANCVQQQVDWKKLVEVPHGFLRSASPFFTRLKSSGTATRPLVDLSLLNAALGKPRSPHLPTPAQTVDFAMRFNMASSLDLSGWYSQLGAGNALASLFGIIVNGVPHAYITMPQGFSESAGCAQAISTRLCSGLEEFIGGIIYDNFLVCAHTDEQLEQNTAVLRDNFKRCNVVENTDKATIGSLVEFCGMILNLRGKDWSVMDSWAKRAAKILRDALVEDSWSYIITFAVFGVAAWFLRVRRQPFCFHREILTAQRLIGRRIARGASWKDSFAPAPTLRVAIEKLSRVIDLNEKIPWRMPRPESKIYDTVILSDASPKYGLGVVVLHQGKVVKCYGRRWTSDEAAWDIHVLEFLAFVEAQKEDCVGNTLFLVDNTIVLNCQIKGHSPRPNLDRLLRNHIRGFDADMGYVPTDLNLSDKASRGDSTLPLDSEVNTFLEALPNLKTQRIDWSYVLEHV